MARRRKRRAPARRRNPTPKTRRRRSVRRNPPMVRQLTAGVLGTLQMIAGKVAARTIPTLANLPRDGAVGMGVQGVVAIVLGVLGTRMLGAEAGKNIMIGALSAPIESALVTANVPFVSEALQPLGSYPQVYSGGVGAYPAVAGVPLGREAVGEGFYSPRPGVGAYPSSPEEATALAQHGYA